jgi:sulfate adenylyltransferase subunit 1
MDILRFITAGSVDDGKSTLIGRLLYDSKSILTDQLEAIKRTGRNNGSGNVDLSLITDGLRAEREQGITIDVAYKYFSTPVRKFIIADSPGHFQYTRNMVTGASNSDLSVILVDARNGVTEQTKRHSIISSLLGISHLVICINKMDLVNYSHDIFKQISGVFSSFAAGLNISNITFIPVSAITGENIVDASVNMPWYNGKTLLQYLEEVEITREPGKDDARFQVQYVIRPGSDLLHDYRGYAGKIISGSFKKGDKIISLPAGITSTIKLVELYGSEKEEAHAPMPATLHLEDDIDISRGDLIASIDNAPQTTQEFEANLCWMDTKPLLPGSRYLLQINSRTVKCAVKEIIYSIDINTNEHQHNTEIISLNDICRIKIKTAAPVSYDSYKTNRANGSFILIDENSNITAGAGMIC